LKKTFRLDLGLEVEGSLFALLSSAKAYKMAFLLSKALKIKLKKDPDIRVPVAGKKILYHLNYICKKDFQVFRLIENKGFEKDKTSLSAPIFEELRDFDFVFYLESQVALETDQIFERIKKMPEVSLIISYDPNKLKGKEYLVSDL
jgi:hypothetical protein